MTITLTEAVAAGSAEVRLANFGAMAQEMFSQAMLGDTAQKVVALAVQTLRCDAAGFLLADGERITTSASSDRDGARADALQVETRQGPGLQAVSRRQPVIATELRFDSRWRFWAPLAADLGFRSVLSLSLVDADTSGALNLYSRRPSAFHSDDLPLAQVFAQHASVAVAVACEREQLLHAMDSRGLVGQAQGVLMERYGITAEQAFTVLRRYSSHLNQELRVIAERVLDDRNLPPLDSAEQTLGHPNGPAAQLSPVRAAGS